MDLSNIQLPSNWRQNDQILQETLLDLKIVENIDEYKKLKQLAEETVANCTEIKSIDIETLPLDLRILIKRLRRLSKPKPKLAPIENFIDYNEFSFLKKPVGFESPSVLSESNNEEKDEQIKPPALPSFSCDFISSRVNENLCFDEFFTYKEFENSIDYNNSSISLVKNIDEENYLTEDLECVIIEKCLLNPNVKPASQSEAWVVADLTGSIILIIEDSATHSTKPLFDEAGYKSNQLLAGTVIRLSNIKPRYICEKLVIVGSTLQCLTVYSFNSRNFVTEPNLSKTGRK